MAEMVEPYNLWVVSCILLVLMGKLTIYSIVTHIPAVEFYFVAAINPVGVVVHLVAVVNMGAVGQVIREIEGNIGFGEADEDVEMGDVNEIISKPAKSLMWTYGLISVIKIE